MHITVRTRGLGHALGRQAIGKLGRKEASDDDTDARRQRQQARVVEDPPTVA